MYQPRPTTQLRRYRGYPFYREYRGYGLLIWTNRITDNDRDSY